MTQAAGWGSEPQAQGTIIAFIPIQAVRGAGPWLGPGPESEAPGPTGVPTIVSGMETRGKEASCLAQVSCGKKRLWFLFYSVCVMGGGGWVP